VPALLECLPCLTASTALPSFPLHPLRQTSAAATQEHHSSLSALCPLPRTAACSARLPSLPACLLPAGAGPQPGQGQACRRHHQRMEFRA
jgi:hypothetical protein